LIESTINDFYSFSFDSSSDQEYLKQFELWAGILFQRIWFMHNDINSIYSK
jgi:hypothetical protein